MDRAALRELPSPNTQPGSSTLAHLQGLMNRRRQILLDNWWEETCPPKYRLLNLQVRRRKPPELSLSRHLLRALIAARTGHGNFAANHRRFNNPYALMECSCGKETTPTHFIHCSRHAQHTLRLRKSMYHAEFVKKLLGPKCHDSFKIFVEEIGCFHIQPTHSSTALNGDQTN